MSRIETAAPPSSTGGPWAAETSQEGIHDFWRALVGSAEVPGNADESPTDGLAAARIAPDLFARRSACWQSALPQARSGSWAAYRAHLADEGALFATTGLSVTACSDVFRSLNEQLQPRLIDAYAAVPSRLATALRVLSDFSEYSRGAMIDAYLARKEAEIHARENDLATTLDSIGDAVMVTDAEGRVARMNPVAERLTGFSMADAGQRPLSEIFRIVHEETGETVESPVPRVLREGVVVGLANHTALVARDGSRRPIADSGAPVRSSSGEVRGVVLVFRDVTEERRAEEALRHWERIFQHATWGVALADIKDVRFRAVNPAYASMHGYTVAELVGAPVSTLWASNTKADMERHAKETHDHGNLVVETTHRRKDGSTLPVEVVATTVKDASGKIVWFVANVQDITERRRLQQSRLRAVELEAQNQRVEEANRLKSEFLANMSHELRTPLNSIIGFTELLHDEQVGPVGPKQKEFLEDILAGGRHLLRLINDVLDLAKVEAGKLEFRPEPVDLARLVATVVQSLRASALEKGILVHAAVDSSLSAVVLDPGRFKQILYNYLSNALKFSPQGGRVELRAVPERGDWFRLEVQDNGPGIPEAQVSRLFVAFQQLTSGTARRVGGTGLGLALTRRLVEAQGGSVGVRPAEAGGSVFFAVLPQQHGGASAPISQPGGANIVKILLVDSQQAEREAIADLLMDAGYEVDAVATVAQGVSALRQGGHAGVLLELRQEEARTLLSLSEDRAGPPLAVLGLGERARAKEVGLSDVLALPVEPGSLLAALREAGFRSPSGEPVLVVDDDPRSLRLMQATLSNLGYEAVCCVDASEALRMLQRFRPVAVIIDIIMPNMDGLAFLRRFRSSERNKGVPAMLWTVKDLTPEERATLEAGVDLVIQKGVGSGSRLAAALQGFLPRRRTEKD